MKSTRLSEEGVRSGAHWDFSCQPWVIKKCTLPLMPQFPCKYNVANIPALRGAGRDMWPNGGGLRTYLDTSRVFPKWRWRPLVCRLRVQQSPVPTPPCLLLRP